MEAARGQPAWAGKKRSGGDIITVVAGAAAVGRGTFLSNAAWLFARHVPVRLCAAAPVRDRWHAAADPTDASPAPPGDCGAENGVALLPWASTALPRELLLIDGGAGLHVDATTLALAGDLLLLVTTPAPQALADTYGLLKYVCTSGFVGRAGLVINAAELPGAARQVAARFARATRRFLGRSLGFLGQVPLDEHVRRAAAQGEPVVARFPQCPASQALKSICARLRPPQSNLARSCGVWSRVAGLFL
jgi:hypothetical protein